MSEPEKQVQHPPAEPEKTRRMMIALSPEIEELLRRLSARTSIPLSELRRAVEESPVVSQAAEQVLRFKYDAWVAELKSGDDIFGRDPKKGAQEP